MARKLLITAGPTVEPIDPVRYISNYSTGTLGYLLAERAIEAGFQVCLITGPVGLIPPKEVETVNVKTTEDMRSEVLNRISDTDCLIMAAAVADFRPVKTSVEKIKKQNKFLLELEKTPDILSEISLRADCLKIGFALETDKVIENGKNKLKAKRLDLIIVNSKTDKNDPFGPGEKEYVFIDSSGEVEVIKKIDKKEMAKKIIEKVIILLNENMQKE